MAKVKKVEGGLLMFKCPACEYVHNIAIDQPYPNGARWNSPTISPSIRVRTGKFVNPDFEEEFPGDSTQCHSYITNGMI